MKMRKIWGIKGGMDPGYEPMEAFNGARAGHVWSVGSYGPIIDMDDDTHRVELEVEGYPEVRSNKETGSELVKMTLRRAGERAPLVHIQLRLIDLGERPTIAASEWEETT
jgi:hypothetical protein